jgi:modulator of FtsH protease HflK
MVSSRNKKRNNTMANFPHDFERQIRELNINPRLIYKGVPILIGAILAVAILATSWVTIDPEEKGVVLRFGKLNRTLDPGLHFKLPFTLDKVFKVPVQRQLKQEFGFRTTAQVGGHTQYSSRDLELESQMLSGDLNVADVEWVTQYRVANPYDYLFKVRRLESTFRDMNEAVMREIVGDRTIDEVLTVGRSEIEMEVRVELQNRVNQYEMGLSIDQVILQDVNPPEPVKPAFNEVNAAQQEAETTINRARAEFNREVPRARGVAQQSILEAQGYAVQRVNRARGETERFNAIFAEYSNAPEVLRQRMYLETMGQVMNRVGRKLIMDEDASGVLPFLNLGQEETHRGGIERQGR